MDVKALLCIFFISCPRNKWFVNGNSLSALLSTVFCYQFAWKQSMYAGNAGSRKYRYNSFIGQYSFADIWTCTLLQAFDTIWAKKGGILCIPLFCSDSGQWVFDYDSFGKMAQMIIFLSLYVKWTPPLEKKLYEQAWIKLLSKLLPCIFSQLGVSLHRVFMCIYRLINLYQGLWKGHCF